MGKSSEVVRIKSRKALLPYVNKYTKGIFFPSVMLDYADRIEKIDGKGTYKGIGFYSLFGWNWLPEWLESPTTEAGNKFIGDEL